MKFYEIRIKNIIEIFQNIKLETFSYEFSQNI
jgi:hypothetical protein